LSSNIAKRVVFETTLQQLFSVSYLEEAATHQHEVLIDPILFACHDVYSLSKTG